MLSLLDKFGITSNLVLGNNTVPRYYKLNNTWFVPSSLPPSPTHLLLSPKAIPPSGKGPENGSIPRKDSKTAHKCPGCLSQKPSSQPPPQSLPDSSLTLSCRPRLPRDLKWGVHSLLFIHLFTLKIFTDTTNFKNPRICWCTSFQANPLKLKTLIYAKEKKDGASTSKRIHFGSISLSWVPQRPCQMIHCRKS